MGTSAKRRITDFGWAAPFVDGDARDADHCCCPPPMAGGGRFAALRPPIPPIPTQRGPQGIRYDFNGGVRVLLPKGRWRVRIEDAASGFECLACDVDGGAITSAHMRHIPFRLRIWEMGKRAPLLDHAMEMEGRRVAVALPIRTLADFIEWRPHVERFRKKHNCRLECLMEQSVAELVSRHCPDVAFIARTRTPGRNLYASFGPGLFVGSEDMFVSLRDGGNGGAAELSSPGPDARPLDPPSFLFPPEAMERPLPTAFVHAATAFCAGDFRTFDQRLAWLSGRAAAMPENDPEADAWRGEVEFLRSLAAHNDIAAMAAHHRRANVLLHGRPSGLPVAASPWTLGSPSVLYLFHREAGGLDREIALMRECFPHYHRLAGGHGAGGEGIMEAEALYHRGDFAGATEAERRAGAAAASERQAGNLLAACFLRMRLSLFGGDWQAARRALADMRGCVRDENLSRHRATVELCEGRLWTALGRQDGVAEWIRRGVGGEDRLHPFAGGYYYIVHGGVLLAEGRWAEAAGLYSWLLEAGTYADKPLLAIYARICLAAAGHARGKTAEAEKELRLAGELAFPDGIVMPFVENWPHIGAIADKAIADAPASLFELGPAWEKRRAGILARYFSPAGPPLTERELELARLAAGGKKYREIAWKVHLAYSTVKRAFATIYRKLGISNIGELRKYMRSVEAD